MSKNAMTHDLLRGASCAHWPQWLHGQMLSSAHCGRPPSCSDTVLSAILQRPQNRTAASCSAELHANRCYHLPLSYERGHFGGEAKKMLRVGCGRLVSRGGCVCLPCFNECRRSSLCPSRPEEGDGEASSALHVAQEGAFAYVLVLAPALGTGVSRQKWRRKYVLSGLRAVLSLQETGARHPVVLLKRGLTRRDISSFEHCGVLVRHMPRLPLTRLSPSFRTGTFHKLAAWSLTEWDRLVVLDLDCVVRRNLDHLFSLPTTPAAVAAPFYAAAGTLSEPGGKLSILPFNSGVMLISPGKAFFAQVLQHLGTSSLWSYDRGDQGWLNTLLATVGWPWYELPRRYNLWMCAQEEELRNAMVWHAVKGSDQEVRMHAWSLGEIQRLDALATALASNSTEPSV